MKNASLAGTFLTKVVIAAKFSASAKNALLTLALNVLKDIM